MSTPTSIVIGVGAERGLGAASPPGDSQPRFAAFRRILQNSPPETRLLDANFRKYRHFRECRNPWRETAVAGWAYKIRTAISGRIKILRSLVDNLRSDGQNCAAETIRV
jgi:hypothetical protein